MIVPTDKLWEFSWVAITSFDPEESSRSRLDNHLSLQNYNDHAPFENILTLCDNQIQLQVPEYLVLRYLLRRLRDILRVPNLRLLKIPKRILLLTTTILLSLQVKEMQ
ncbi:unnamed protein product [Allacma fusca]|uniref:Uncharacterized protein n=1 Tax=Allacma fusca TaxID=39272 RepID=A0A8J2NIR7_9HEXA|nr:unnamed protein product [Allacma fusca]